VDPGASVPDLFAEPFKFASVEGQHETGEENMPSDAELQSKFWSALQSDMTMMLGLTGVDEGHTRPMTAQVEGDRGPIWFFTSTDSALVDALGAGGRAIATFASKGHDVFAAVHGDLSVERDRSAVDRLWNRHVAAWYEGGKDDPKLVLLRLDPDKAQIWKNGSSLLAGVMMLLGSDPKEDYKDNEAKVTLE
jgi:general stress protein 26